MEEMNSVLIVDDEKANLLYLNQILSEDYKIYTARDSGEAIDRAGEYLPDLILLDIIMPDKDGYETLVTLKELETTRNIPVVFITGLSASEDEMKGLDLGAEDYITKPFNAAIVKLRVRNQIKMVNQMRAIERMSMFDQLTDIANRRFFDQQISLEWRKSIRMQAPISLLMTDVDMFKVYNDTYGHQQGDAALQAVAQILKQNIRRPSDFAARWGGEEFTVILPMTDWYGALSIAELIRNSVEGVIIPGQDGRETKITISIGVNSHIPVLGDSLNEFVLKADKALYRAKKTGRNRVIAAGD